MMKISQRSAIHLIQYGWCSIIFKTLIFFQTCSTHTPESHPILQSSQTTTTKFNKLLPLLLLEFPKPNWVNVIRFPRSKKKETFLSTLSYTCSDEQLKLLYIVINLPKPSPPPPISSPSSTTLFEQERKLIIINFNFSLKFDRCIVLKFASAAGARGDTWGKTDSHTQLLIRPKKISLIFSLLSSSFSSGPKKKIIKKNKGEVPNGWPALRPRRPCGPGGATSWTVVPPASKRPRCPRGLRTSSDGSNRCFTPRSLSQPTPSPTTTQQPSVVVALTHPLMFCSMFIF